MIRRLLAWFLFRRMSRVLNRRMSRFAWSIFS